MTTVNFGTVRDESGAPLPYDPVIERVFRDSYASLSAEPSAEPRGAQRRRAREVSPRPRAEHARALADARRAGGARVRRRARDVGRGGVGGRERSAARARTGRVARAAARTIAARHGRARGGARQ